MSRMGGSPKKRLYSRLNCEGLSYLYVALGRRLGVPLGLVQERQHMYVRYVGSDGPAFDAAGEVVKDPAVEKSLMEDYARKYPEGWARFADKFRDGFKTGERVLVRYTPK